MRSPWSGDGYGWFLRRLGDHTAACARGHGGPFIHVVPATGTVVAFTSDVGRAARGGAYTGQLHALVERSIA